MRRELFRAKSRALWFEEYVYYDDGTTETTRDGLFIPTAVKLLWKVEDGRVYSMHEGDEYHHDWGDDGPASDAAYEQYVNRLVVEEL